MLEWLSNIGGFYVREFKLFLLKMKKINENDEDSLT